ncbi:hypothetical protein ABW20_dc0107800 [Dactylellina cionopaga]|nr:hypothetical protein ABW20_dc0107800 [Dactylellina cionopaga]
MSYPHETTPVYPDQQYQTPAPYGQPSGYQSPPPNYGQKPFPTPDHQQQHQQYQQYQQPYATPPVQSPPPVAQQPSFNSQPAPQPQMEPKGAHGGNGLGKPDEWNFGMCSCFSDCGRCCLTCWCPCITYGRIQHRLRNNDMSNYKTCNGKCWAFCGLMTVCGVQWVLSMVQRGELRHRYNLKGSGCGDCCRHFCCECCALIQEDRELETRKALLVPANQVGYQQQGGMTYPQH